MQQISSFPLLAPLAQSVDASGSDVLSSATTENANYGAMPDGPLAQTEFQDFQQVFQSYTLNKEGLSSNALGFEQWQRLSDGLSERVTNEQPEVGSASGQLDLLDLDLEASDTLDNTVLLTQLPVSSPREGQGLSPVIPPSGEVLPLGMQVSEAPFSQGLANSEPVQNQVNTTISAPIDNSLPPAALQTAWSEPGDRASDVLGQQTIQNTRALLRPELNNKGLNENSPLPPPGTELKSAYSESLNPARDSLKANVAMQATENPGKQLDGRPVLTTNVQGFEQGLNTASDITQGLNPIVQNESDARAKAQFDFFTREAAGPELAETADIDRLERPTNATSDVRSRIQGPGLSQYATGVSVSVDDPNWGDQMSQKIVWLSGRNIQSAEIQLSPVELGPVEVKISVQNDQTTVTFNAQQASVRELLENNVHRLREMMSENGVDLADVNVASDDQNDHYPAQQNNGDDESGSNQVADSDEGNATTAHSSESQQDVVTVSAPNMIDFYA